MRKFWYLLRPEHITAITAFCSLWLIFGTILPVVAQATSQTTTEACSVSTDQVRTVRIRVGPGENRSAYTFLPANEEFVVLGQATALDDTQWWKLDRAEVAPNKQAEQAWVAQEAVTASGECDAVPEAPPPPIIASTAGPLAKLISDADPALCPGATSAEIVQQSWDADVQKAASCVQNLLEWQSEASEQQLARLEAKVCDQQPSAEELDSYFTSNWAVTDLAAGYYNLGLALKEASQSEVARSAFRVVINSYPCAWAWDTRGWFWSLKEGAEKEIN
jgi:hypothetical protein